MAEFYPFRALRPAKEKAANVACLPYDVLSEQQARTLAADPESFIHVIKSEADLPEGTDLYSGAVYETAAANLAKMKQDGILEEAEEPEYYIYREISSDHTQTGVVGTVSCADYEAGIIRRHELTVPEKEDDRTRHILTCRAQTGLVFLTFPDNAEVAACITEITAKDPENCFEQNGVTHQVWPVRDAGMIERLREAFRAVPALYIADGHHRAASSCRVASALNADDTAEAGRFMAAAFPADDLSLLGYHRYVKDLAGMSETEFLERVSESFDLAECSETRLPEAPHEIILCMKGTSFVLTPHSDRYDASDSISRLDVSILQNSLLAPVLGIQDPRTDKRISFVGGQGAGDDVRALSASGGVGFILYPTDIHDLISVADDRRIMPPKSTWFEPKLLSGLFVHQI